MSSDTDAGQRAWLHQCGQLVAGTDGPVYPGCRCDVQPREVEARYVLTPIDRQRAA